MKQQRRSGLPPLRPAWWLLAVAWAATACADSGDSGFDRSQVRDDPILQVVIDGAEAEDILAGPIGGTVTNDRGYRAEQVWAEAGAAGLRAFVSEAVELGATFHEIRCLADLTVLEGTHILPDGTVVGLTVSHRPDDQTLRAALTWLDPEPAGAQAMWAPATPTIGDGCDPELVAAAGLA